MFGCSSPKPTVEYVYRDRVVPSKIDYFPAAKVPAAAPASSTLRCESLPNVSFKAETATIKQLLLEIQNSRSRYVECANRHNVLVDFNEKMEKGLLEVLNHYKTQSGSR